MSTGPIDPLRVDATAPEAARARGTSDPSDGAAFRALLDRLASGAERLSRGEDAVTDARSLAGAVEDARAVLSDALSLKEQLLEAYRQRRATGE